MLLKRQGRGERKRERKKEGPQDEKEIKSAFIVKRYGTSSIKFPCAVMLSGVQNFYTQVLITSLPPLLSLHRFSLKQLWKGLILFSLPRKFKKNRTRLEIAIFSLCGTFSVVHFGLLEKILLYPHLNLFETLDSKYNHKGVQIRGFTSSVITFFLFTWNLTEIFFFFPFFFFSRKFK